MSLIRKEKKPMVSLSLSWGVISHSTQNRSLYLKPSNEYCQWRAF